MYTYRFKHTTVISYNTITTTELWVLNGKAEADVFRIASFNNLFLFCNLFSFVAS